MITEKQFKTNLSKITKTSEQLQNMIHQSAMFALFHVNSHNNTTPAKELINALPKSQRKETLKAWFVKFGQVQLVNGEINFKGKKRITDNQDDAWVKADETPYWELLREESAEKQLVKVDFEKRILGLFKALANADEIENQELLASYWEVTPASIREKVFA